MIRHCEKCDINWSTIVNRYCPRCGLRYTEAELISSLRRAYENCQVERMSEGTYNQFRREEDPHPTTIKDRLGGAWVEVRDEYL